MRGPRLPYACMRPPTHSPPIRVLGTRAFPAAAQLAHSLAKN